MRLGLRPYIIILFIVAVLLVTTAAAAFAIARGTSEIRSSMVDQQRQSADAAANAVGDFLDSSRTTMTTTTARIRSSDLEPTLRPDAVQGILDPLIAYGQDFQGFLLLDDQGQVLLAHPQREAWQGLDFASDPAFTQASRDDTSVFSDQGPVPPAYWASAVPASDPSHRAVLVGVLDIVRLQELLFANKPSTSTTALVTSSGEVLVTTDPALSTEDVRAWSTWPDLSIGRILSVEGDAPHRPTEVLATASVLPGYSTHIMMLSPRSQIVDLQNELVQNAVFTSAGLALVGIMLGVLVAGQIARPIDEVRKAARRVSSGDLTVRAKPRGPREMQDLARDFNSMADALGTEWERRMLLQAHLEDKVNERTQQLQEKQQEMEQFFYGVSHDFKSPVIVISGFAQLAEEALTRPGTSRAEVRDFVRRIRRSSLNLQLLVTQVLQFAAADHGDPIYQKAPIETVLAPVLEEARVLAHERRIRLDAAGPPIEVNTDAERLGRIVANLVQNALKYMPAKRDARVRVEWSSDEAGVTLKVVDNGAGIDPEVLPRLFQPFVRHVPKGVDVKGTGLGLSIVKRLVDSLQGHVRVESQPGRGSTFVVELPDRHEPGGPPT